MALRANNHHLYFPRSLYRKANGIAWKFYNLPCNQIRWSVEHHDEWHAHMECPTTLPTREFMTRRVAAYEAGRCGCTHHPSHHHRR